MDIYTYNPQTDQEVRLTEAEGVSIQPLWSPNGQFVAYFFFDINTDRVDIWLVDTIFGHPPRPATLEGIGAFSSLSWSSDSYFILYEIASTTSSEQHINRLNIVSGEIISLTDNSQSWNAHPAWSPDGSLIAFTSDRYQDGILTDDIWVMTSDGSAQTNLINNHEFLWEDSRPSWSPDSGEIAFLRSGPVELRIDYPGGIPGLWVVARDGAYERLVYESEQVDFSEPPVWSPDGNWIAFNAGQLGETDVWVVPAQGGVANNVSDLPGEEGSIAWSPDSESLLFTSSHLSTTSLYITAIDGSDTHLLNEGSGNGYADWWP